MKRPLTLALLMGLAFLSACAGSEDSSPSSGSFPYIRLAPTPPPEAVYEEPPQNMYPTSQIWRRGYWTYDGANFLWTPGRFIDRPNPTAAWSADRWERHSFGWGFVPGHWQ